MFILPFHNIDPVLFRINDALSLNWYGISYLLGVFFVMYQSDKLIALFNISIPKDTYKNLMFWAMIGIVVGGRLGEVFFYDFYEYISHPLTILQTWKGGMSFHGGLIGGVIVGVAHVYRHR
jgi:phosphatidylglycerol---prolipoprotein diacylglyceryl transferase